MAEPKKGLGLRFSEGFISGFGNQVDFGTIFGRNKILREKQEQAKKDAKAINARQFIGRGVKNLVPGTKAYKEFFESGATLFPDQKQQMNLYLNANDRAIQRFQVHLETLTKGGFSPAFVSETFETKGMDGILLLLEKAGNQKRTQEERNLLNPGNSQQPGATNSNFRPEIKEETLSGSISEATTGEVPNLSRPPTSDVQPLNANQGIPAREAPQSQFAFGEKKLTQMQNELTRLEGVEKQVTLGSDVQKQTGTRITRIRQDIKTLQIQMEKARESAKGGRLTVLEKARGAFVEGKASPAQHKLLKINPQPDRLKIMEQARKNVNLSLPKGILGSVQLSSFGKNPEDRLRRVTEMIQGEADRIEKELKRVGDRPDKPPSKVGQGILQLEEAFANKTITSVADAKELLQQTGQLSEEEIQKIIDAFQSE